MWTKNNIKIFYFRFISIVLQLIILIGNASAAKKLNASQAFDNTWSTATDLENELEVSKLATGLYKNYFD